MWCHLWLEGWRDCCHFQREIPRALWSMHAFAFIYIPFSPQLGTPHPLKFHFLRHSLLNLSAFAGAGLATPLSVTSESRNTGWHHCLHTKNHSYKPIAPYCTWLKIFPLLLDTKFTWSYYLQPDHVHSCSENKKRGCGSMLEHLFWMQKALGPILGTCSF